MLRHYSDCAVHRAPAMPPGDCDCGLDERLQTAERVIEAARPFLDGFKPDPGTSDLYNEQPITVRVLLGDWRKLRVWFHAYDEVCGKERT